MNKNETLNTISRSRRHNNTTMKRSFLLIGILTGAFYSSAVKLSKHDYVSIWKDVAIGEMLDHKIPASITLAQGILESGSGNSLLAVEGNNHFGIKCHGWTGEKIYKDDDAKNECFRKYDSADESFEDHSDFLLKHERYADLFSYDITDYKNWAKGLKKAGYATNPKYADLLIELIEDLELYQYDTYQSLDPLAELLAENVGTNYSDMKEMNDHQVYVNAKKVRYVVAKKGDTFYQVAKEFGLNLAQLHRYNSFPKDKDCLVEGDIVYIMPKKRASLFKKETVSIEQPMHVQEISQKYGVSEKTLKRLNRFADDNLVSEGEIVTLR